MGKGRGECQRTECTATAEWRPVIVARARGFELVPLRCVVGIALCGICKTRLKLGDVLSDSLWTAIVEGVISKNKLPPDRALTTLDFCLLKSKESRELESRRPS